MLLALHKYSMYVVNAKRAIVSPYCRDGVHENNVAVYTLDTGYCLLLNQL